MSLTLQNLIRDLQSIGLRSGDVVLFHSSLSSMGHVEGGAETVIDALEKVVGSEGTVAAPTIIHTSGLPRPPFDPAFSPSEVGVCTLFHYAQKRYLEKHQPEYAQAIPFPYFSHEKMGQKIKDRLDLQSGRIGLAESWLLNARDIVDQTERVLEEEPLSLADENQPSPFMAWAANQRGRSLTMRGGMGSAPLERLHLIGSVRVAFKRFDRQEERRGDSMPKSRRGVMTTRANRLNATRWVAGN